MPKKPRAAGADLHRQPDPEPEPDSNQGGDIDLSELDNRQAAQPDSGGSMSPISSINNKTLLLIGLALVLGYFAYRQTRSSGGSDDNGDDGPAFEDPEEDPGPGMPNITRDTQDPLKADEEALDWLTGEKAEELAEYYGDS